MDTLTVFASTDLEFNDHAVVRVYWCTGLHRKKAVDVRLALTCQDRQAAAEAIAIRYLLGEMNVFNANRTGINLRIVVSKGAIKKMARQTTQKIDLYEYGYPILTRYGEAKIEVSKDRSWFPPDETLTEVPLIQGETLRGIEKLESETMGLVAVTRHALERYAEHCGTLDMNTTWKNLHRRLKGCIEKIPLPPKVITHKLKKYGEAPEVWKHPDDPLHYVFCSRSDHKVLVTVFNKDPEEAVTFRPLTANR
jgi:hypothetical protein